MSYESLLIHEITVFNPVPGVTNRYGDEEPAFDDGVTEKARVQQGTTSGVAVADEELRDRDTRITRFVVFLMPGSTVNALSEIGFQGHRHRVIGVPAEPADDATMHHLEAIMERIEG